MQIRARRQDHLVLLKKRFPKFLGRTAIIITRNGDYLFRLETTIQDASVIMSELVLEQTWSNFKKESCTYQGAHAESAKAVREYNKALMDVYWDAGELQEGGPYGAGISSLHIKDFQSAGTQVKDIHMGDKFKVPVGDNIFRLLPAKTGKLATTTMEKLFKRKKK